MSDNRWAALVRYRKETDMEKFKEQLVEFIREHSLGLICVRRDREYLEIDPEVLADALIESGLVKEAEESDV